MYRQRRNMPAHARERVPIVAQQLEVLLYIRAQSLEEYGDVSTLPIRLANLMRDLRQQVQRVQEEQNVESGGLASAFAMAFN